MGDFIHTLEPGFTCGCGLVEEWECKWCGLHVPCYSYDDFKKRKCPGDKDTMDQKEFRRQQTKALMGTIKP